jgi:hypothetical protein
MNYGKFEVWLRSNLRGYSELGDEIRPAILYFSVAWSLFEYRAIGGGDIRQGLNAFVADQIPLDAEMRPFAPAIQHFIKQYVKEGDTNDAFDSLVKNNPGYDKDISPALLGKDSSSRGQILALLYTIYCLRNNMVHGLKWEWGYQNQLENLDESIGVLNVLLDEYLPKDGS